MLHGRAAEQSVIDRLIAGAREGRSGVLVVRGDPGIGKTALLDYAVSAAGADAAEGPAAAAVRVVRGVVVESEAELPFAGLHLLLGTALDRLSALPGPQRDALGAAFGLGPAVPGDRFLLGLAVLSLLAELAEDGPLLFLVDDACWLDRASAEALVFAARRLDAEGVAVIFAARDHEPAPFPALGLPDVRLGGLDEASAAVLMMEHGGADLPPETRYRILAEARGNPLGLIELPAAYLRAPPSAAWPGGAGPALTDRLRQTFRGQVQRLPEPTQNLLLVAAAQGGGDLAAVLEAAGVLGAAVADLELAERAGLVRVSDGNVTFRHPLVRAAVYHGAALSRRLTVHRALAEALRNPADADRRAWHLAAAATGPDEAVAAELERSAAAAGARSGYAAAAAAYERAVQLSADPAAQAGRMTLAADAAVQIGEFDRARSLAGRATGQATDPVARARLTSILALSDFGQGRLAAAHRLLVDGAQIGGVHPARMAKFLMNAMHIAWLLDDEALIADTADRLKAAGEPAGAPFASLVALMLRSTTQAIEQSAEDSPPLAELVAQAWRCRVGDRDDLAMIAMASLVTGRNSEARDLTAELVADARAQGRIGWLPAIMNCHAQALVFDGRHRDALSSAAEALRIALDTGQPQWTSEANAVMAYLAAVAGEEERCRELVDAVLAEPASHFTSAAKPWAHWALGVLDLGRGRPEAALVQLEAVIRVPTYHHGSALRSVPDMVEAAVRLGQPERAARPLASFSAWARRADTPNTDALVQRCLALLATDEDAERHYLAALETHELSFERARTQLLYGAWLRRTRRKADARTPLRAALDHLLRTGATPWAQQARTELAATGTATPRPGGVGPAPLTPQELQVARLAAQGLSNRDIAAQLFLSPRTVAYHLYKAYPKLGITSRTEFDLDTLEGP